MASKRIGKVSERVFYYPPNITDFDIDNGNVANDGSDMLLLDPSEYSVYKREGDFVFIINCNRDKVVSDEFGNEIPVDYNSPIGVFTKFRGFVILEITVETIPMQFSSEIGSGTRVTPFRYKLKFPQYAPRNESFSKPGTTHAGVNDSYNIRWRKQHYTFSGGSLYSVAKFHGLTYNKDNSDDSQFDLDDGFFNQDEINEAGRTTNGDAYNNVGIIINGTYGYDAETLEYSYINDTLEFPSNSTTRIDNTLIPCFGANWMNLSIHLPQVGYMTQGWSHIRSVRSADHFTKQLNKNTSFNSHFFNGNSDPIAAGVTNTQFMARSDLNWTDFIYVPKEDIIKLNQTLTKGFISNVDGKTITTTEGNYTLKGTYRNGAYIPSGWSEPCPINGGKINGMPSEAIDPKTYFYKGFDSADCIKYLIELGII